MAFADRITAAPIPHDAGRGAEARARFPDAPPALLDLVEGAAGCSPYLTTLLDREEAWLTGAVEGSPEAAFAALVAETRALGADALGTDALGAGLRRVKRRVALLVALADLGGVWDLDEVTGALTDFADAAVAVALRRLVATEIRRGKVPGAGEGDEATAAGMVVLAMGKQAARELNYSSDIDLVCLFDESRYAPDAVQEARAVFIRVTRRLTATLSEATGEGYVFRTDLRLRPDAQVTPVCISMEAAERYYESLGRTWERAAYVKARPCAGDIAAGEAFLDRLRPFVWRKHLDFAAIEDAHDMRLRIRSAKGLGGAIVLDGHDLKLGQGGIREIEFFTQTRQIIAGGRDPDLRTPRTTDALARLAARGWVPDDVAATLAADYRAHRRVEHRLQMIHDAQTHALPSGAADFDRLARFLGEGDTAALRRRLGERLTRVAGLTEGFFAPGRARPDPELPEEIAAAVEGWARYPALRSPRAVEVFERIRPGLLSRLMQAARPGEAVAAFEGFLAGLPAGVQLFSLFEANPHLIDLIVDVTTVAPALAGHLSRNPEVLDAVLGGDFFSPWPGGAALGEDLSGRMAAVAEDYERQLDTARRWTREWRFRIGVHLLRGLIDTGEAERQYADLAGAVVAALWQPVVAAFAAKHGAPPGQGAAVVAMGSLGAAALTETSDLDLLVIYDAGGVEASDGDRPLSARAYYARLTQALVTALSAPMAEGRLYAVDMRLRPSGRQGPVATSLAAFAAYQRDDAWTWEHLALTRARPVAGDPALGGTVEALRRELLAETAAPARVRAGMADMRARLAGASPPGSVWETRRGPGRAQEVELMAEATALLAASPARDVAAQLAAGAAAGVVAAADAAALTAAHALFRRVQVAARLITGERLDPEAIGSGGRAFLLRATGAADIGALAAEIRTAAEGAAAIIDAALDGVTAERSA